MNKRQFYLFGLVGALLLILTGIYVMSQQKIEAYAMSVIYEGEAYPIQFSTTLKADSITNGSIIIFDEFGQKVNPALTLSESKKELIITGLVAGNYTIDVKKNAFASKTKFKRDRTFDLQVVQPVTELKTEADLKAYFEQILARDNASYGFATEESAVTSVSKNEVASDSSSGGGGSGRASTTNNQVAGIEEGDIVITDGQAIYSIVDNVIVITDAKKPSSMKVASRIKLADGKSPTHLMKHDDLLIVAYSGYEERSYGQYYDGKSVTKVGFYDVSDVSKPRLVREIGQDGYTIGVRKMNDVLYIVSNQTPNYWLLHEDVDIELRPATYDGVKSDVMPIERIHPLPGSTEPNYLIVSAVNVHDIANAKVTTESYLGNSGEMYMSEKAIYMTAINYGWMPFLPAVERMTVDAVMPTTSNETTIYKVAISETNIEMKAQGKVKGHVLNQFSMDEHDGYFRIATTEGSGWGANADSTNTLYILDGNLKEVGKVDQLARGERIYSARFMGDKAYIVTFKETDPLFVIDVANPKAPKVLGELKIPGFSNYLHPVGEHHLLGIGYDTTVTMQPGSKEPLVLTQGMKMSLFNVEDLANPVEQDAVTIGGRGTYSDVQHDHKALFRDVENNYYGFPVTIYEPKGEYDLNYKGTGAQIYQVTTNGIKLAADFVKPAAKNEQYEDWESVVQRLLYIDDTLYTVSRKEIKSYKLDGFTPISSVKIQ
ncbi:MAG: beta-propeller domain-containing protein [Solibacillus sp.]